MSAADETTAGASTDGMSERRRVQVYLDDEDVMVRLLGLAEGDYECVRVDTAYAERALLEGDRILFTEESEPEDGDIVLIEEDGEMRLGIASAPGYLLTLYGPRMLEPGETIIGVGVGLIRRLRRQ